MKVKLDANTRKTGSTSFSLPQISWVLTAQCFTSPPARLPLAMSCSLCDLSSPTRIKPEPQQ